MFGIFLSKSTAGQSTRSHEQATPSQITTNTNERLAALTAGGNATEHGDDDVDMGGPSHSPTSPSTSNHAPVDTEMASVVDQKIQRTSEDHDSGRSPKSLRRSNSEEPSTRPPPDKFRAVAGPSRQQLDHEAGKRRRAQLQAQEKTAKVKELENAISVLQAQLGNTQTELTATKEVNQIFQDAHSKHYADAAAMENKINEQFEELKKQKEAMEKMDQERLEAIRIATSKESELLTLKNRDPSTLPIPTASTPSSMFSPPHVETTAQATTPSSSSSSSHPPPRALDSNSVHLYESLTSYIDTAFSQMKTSLEQNLQSSNCGQRQHLHHPASSNDSSGDCDDADVEDATADDRPSRRKIYPSVKSHRTNICKQVKESLSERDYASLRANIRTVIKKVSVTLGINCFGDYQPADPSVVELYHESKAEGPDGAEFRFKLSFTDNWYTCLWNIKVVDNMVTALIDEYQVDLTPGDAEKNRLWLSCEFWTSIVQAQQSWARSQPRLNPDTAKEETNEEMRERVDNQRCARKAYTTSRSRKERKLKERQKAIAHKLKTLIPSSSEGLRWRAFQSLVDTLDVHGQSSDEESIEHPCLLERTVPFYRRRAISGLMTEVDKEVMLQLRYSRNRDKSRKIRQKSDRISRTSETPGLPGPFYHRSFVKSLGRADLVRLRVNEKAPANQLLQFVADSDAEDVMET